MLLHDISQIAGGDAEFVGIEGYATRLSVMLCQQLAEPEEQLVATAFK